MSSALTDVSNAPVFAKRISKSDFEKQSLDVTTKMIQELNEQVRKNPSVAKGSKFFANKENIVKGLPVFQGKHSRFEYDSDEIKAVLVNESENTSESWEMGSDSGARTRSVEMDGTEEEEWRDSDEEEWSSETPEYATRWLENSSFVDYEEDVCAFPGSPDMDRESTELGWVDSTHYNQSFYEGEAEELSCQLDSCKLDSSNKSNTHVRFGEDDE
ncbi:hypothetical protein CYMTET_26149 [Cymbomonas tetramitiformis]|uniref:Uncharacterized protein n=1 Tax=Cymbomonas tetramitiformis TaxID=36881 RepID=A0AAE0FSC9_9CHLO|nr:hypothetical protein CYMTET_26149 [Cymbomonas tetramitiformis]|eukprot:gene26581-32636_t